ncbi:MAG: prolyl oligopeptidase family serine peptidase [Asticcacaulis sp.]
MKPTRLIILDNGPENMQLGQWPDRVVEQVNRPELHIYDVENPLGHVLVCSGGGYLRLMHDREGVEVALWLNRLGYSASVLVHRLPGAIHSGDVWPKDIALTDAMLALRHIERNVPLFIMGLSSGGHLAGVIACQPQTKAAGVLIAYAPINANHAEYKYPAGKPDYPPPEKQAFYNDWPIGIAAEPHGLPDCPVFLAYALHDQAVPIDHALNIIKAARDTGRDLDAHIFGQAPHGFALRDTDGTHAVWPQLAAEWMARKINF